MANFDLLTVYSLADAAWLEEQGHPHPPVGPGNRMPTTADMKWALEFEDGLSYDLPSDDGELWGTSMAGQSFAITGFDWEADDPIPGEYVTIRGTEVILAVLIRLCRRCGQLYVYPDSGAPAIVLDATLDAEAVAQLYAEAGELVDGWAYFFEHMYGVERDHE